MRKSYWLILIVIFFIVLIIFIKPKFINFFLIKFDPFKTNLLNVKNFPTKVGKNININLDGKNKKVIINNQINLQKYQPLYFSVKNISDQTIIPKLIINDKDWSSGEAIVKTILNGSENLSDEEKAIKIFDYVSQNIYHFYQPYYKRSDFSSPVNFFNIFGYGLCSDAAYAFSRLSSASGLTTRMIHLNQMSGLSSHAVAEIFFNAKWHMFDPDRGAYYRAEDGSIASVVELLQNPQLIDKNITYKDGDYWLQFYSFNHGWIRNIEEEEASQKLIKNKTKNFFYQLRQQEEIRFYYDWPDSWYWHDFGNKPPKLTNGMLISPIRENDLSAQIRLIKLPYVITKIYLRGLSLCQKANQIYISTEGLESWNSLTKYCRQDVIDASSLFPTGEESSPTFSYLLKFENLNWIFPVYVYTQFQVAPKSIPKLDFGENIIKVGDMNEGSLRLNFTFKEK